MVMETLLLFNFSRCLKPCYNLCIQVVISKDPEHHMQMQHNYLEQANRAADNWNGLCSQIIGFLIYSEPPNSFSFQSSSWLGPSVNPECVCKPSPAFNLIVCVSCFDWSLLFHLKEKLNNNTALAWRRPYIISGKAELVLTEGIYKKVLAEYVTRV